MFDKYKSPFGYQVGDNGIDSYGVDHSGFSLRDEIEYQTARDNRESQLMQMYNQQGITDNYPQYTTNFWGDAGNNYGFGSSNISQNIQKITDQFNNGSFAGGTNGFGGNSFAGNGSSFSSGNSFGGNANGSDRYSWNSGYSTTPTLQTRTPTPWSPTTAPTYTTQTPWRNNQTLTPWNGGYDLSRYPQSSTNATKPIDYSLYGDGFSKEFIDKMENDAEFQKILNEYIIPNEGGYNNDPDDTGGETNMGIAKKAHENEDILNMTRERANAIYYRDYYNWNGLNKLPYPIRGFVVDYGLPTRPQLAVETVHKVLDLPPQSNIIGPETLGKFENYTEEDYNNFLERYRAEMKNHFREVAQRNPQKRKFLNGWLNRANKAHLAR